MTILIRSSMSQEEVQRALQQLPKPKLFEPEKHSGKLTLKLDPAEFQRKIRDEWA